MDNKKCYKCGEIKSLCDFYKNKDRKDGLDHTCKICKKEYAIQYRIKNKKLIAQKRKEYTLENKEKVKSQKLKSRIKNKEKIKVQKQKYYQLNKFKINSRNKKYNNKNRDRLKPYYKQYNTQYCNNRRKTDINFKLRSGLRIRINKALKNNQKCGHTMDILGCTVEEFKKHLETSFQDQMTWYNYGFGSNKWNIDHIIPCASFDLSDESQQRICFHYSNMQPLWQKDNMKKGDKIIIPYVPAKTQD